MRRSMVWSLAGIILVAIVALGATVASGHKPLLGLDLKGGVSVVLQPQGTVDDATLGQAVSIIQRRVDGLGVANSNVQRQGKDVLVELPGIKDSQSALKVLGTTATLYFRPYYCEIAAYVAPKAATTPATTTPATTTPATTAPATTTPATTAPATTTPATTTPATTAPVGAGKPSAEHLNARLASAVRPASLQAPAAAPTPTAAAASPTAADCNLTNTASIPTTSPDAVTADATIVVPASPTSGLPAGYRYILGPADLTGKGVSGSSVGTDSTGAFVVDLTFNSGGAKLFNKMAEQRYAVYAQDKTTGKTSAASQEAIELDGVLESAPVIQTSNFGNNAQISGTFTSAQANSLSLELRYGSLPVRFTPQSVQTVSASIGSDSLKAGLLAGLGGIILVMLYMILYYRALGVVVLIGLGVGAALLYSILTELSQSSSLALTLSGVTGIIVSVGITVDSYVVYFERLKDEVRAGRSIRQSTERSFKRAFRTVLTADFVSFLAALILYLFTVGDVRGFAFTLGLSTLLDVFTAYFFIRPMVVLVGRRKTFTENRILGVARGLGASSGAGT